MLAAWTGTRAAAAGGFSPGGHDGGFWSSQLPAELTSPTGRLGHYVLGFGQDPAGEMYVLTTDQTGPTGTTGQVLKLVRPSG